MLLSALEGPGGVWCDVDVVEFSYYGAPAPTPKEQLYSNLVDGLRGSDDTCIGSGSQMEMRDLLTRRGKGGEKKNIYGDENSLAICTQTSPPKPKRSHNGGRGTFTKMMVASLETYGTLGAIVKSRTGGKQVGFLTNRHVAVDLDYPNQKMFHPLPPNLGPGVYLGAVERATSFITDDLWYGIFAGTNPETFVRADGAFVPFADDFNMSNATTLVKGVGEIGDVKVINLQSPISSLIGCQVVKVGRSSGLTTGTVMAYALEYNYEKGICFFTDFLVVGENQQTFDLEGDSGSLIILTAQGGDKPHPIGIIWGGTANRGRLKLKTGQGPENWTSGVDLGRLLDLLELDLITTSEGLQEMPGFPEAIQEQRNALAATMDSPPVEGTTLKDNMEKIYEPLDLNIQHYTLEEGSGTEFQVNEIEVAPNVERQFISSLLTMSPVHRDQQEDYKSDSKNLSTLRNIPDEDLCVSLQLGDRKPKRQCSDSALDINT
ncbi:hypothetical protein QJS10_CPA09g00892 [Acorus calamus]|uniref:Nal1 C-terminal domain-containing protein n=1 Tax=Acorus calamus TaxID=4465 RepID=A0AAV9E514_ACOCL|nr:hypothetical protein QJS10_CPA09g00892 [Acorus calamus]